jgi:hypothetical protein
MVEKLELYTQLREDLRSGRPKVIRNFTALEQPNGGCRVIRDRMACVHGASMSAAVLQFQFSSVALTKVPQNIPSWAKGTKTNCSITRTTCQ